MAGESIAAANGPLAALEMGAYFAALVGFLVGTMCWCGYLFQGRRSERVFTAGWWFVLLGLGALATTFFARAFQPEHPRLPLSTLFEIVLLVQLGAAGALLVVTRRAPELRLASPFVMAVTIALWVYGRARHEPMTEDLMAALQSVWLQIHVATAVLSYGPLFVSGITSAMAWWMFREVGEWTEPAPPAEEGGAPGPSTAERFESWTYRVIAFGFPWLTALIITGAVWANYAWGRAWGWDPKEMWSAITWVIYVAYLHMRLRGGWRGRPASIMATVAWIAMLVTFLGVNWIVHFFGVDSLHTYSE